MQAPVRRTGNRLLDSIPDGEYRLIEPALQRISLTLKQVLSRSDSEITHVHFPVTAMASLLMVMEEDDPVEVATVGNEGMVGLVVSLGVALSPHHVICQMGGDCLRLTAREFRDFLDQAPVLTRIMQKYIAFSLREAGQTIACNALHTVDTRACRWLLICHDQAGRDEFPMTQEFLAYMLGVRRQTVTVVAGTLQNAGLIQVRRGFINILDRAGLEDAVCECYKVTSEYYKKVLLA